MGQAEAFEVIVAGAGTAGCVVAGELAAAGVRVLLLEAGRDAEELPATQAALRYKEPLRDRELMYERLSVPQRAIGGRRQFLGSGRCLGGSGQINGMLYFRSDARDWDAWRTPGWSWSEVRPAFEEIERALQPEHPPPSDFLAACLAAGESRGFRQKPDLNSADGALSDVIGPTWLTVSKGERRGTYAAFLRPRRERLTVRTKAVIRRIVIDNGRAVAVEYTHRGETCRAEAEREIILCLGALETPKLLMLSGIGPADHLRAHDISVAADLPSVGAGLHDHLAILLLFRASSPPDAPFGRAAAFRRVGQRDRPDGAFIFCAAEALLPEVLMCTAPAMLLPPRLHATTWGPSPIRGAIELLFRAGRGLISRCWAMLIFVSPEGRGTLRLASRDPAVPGEIDPAYLENAGDLSSVLEAIRVAHTIAGAPALESFGNRPLISASAAKDRPALERFVRATVAPSFHFAGTCRMGTDPLSVVDELLRVRGVERLRVADASIMPSIPVAPPNGACALIGYRAAQFIR
jgi:choline dehydrogenase